LSNAFAPRKFAILSFSVEQFPKSLQPVLKLFHVDFTPAAQPSAFEVVIASIVALVGSLVIDALLVVVGTKIFPSTKGYVHFRFSDYAKLTIIGVVVACAAWPIVTRLSSTPRWLFLRLAALVSLVLLLPDALIWYQGSPAKAVFVLVWMHVGIALVTYNALVRLAPTNRARHARR
jgi:hypothetical protein